MFTVPSRPSIGNGVSTIDCKEYMISLKKKLENLLKRIPKKNEKYGYAF